MIKTGLGISAFALLVASCSSSSSSNKVTGTDAGSAGLGVTAGGSTGTSGAAGATSAAAGGSSGASAGGSGGSGGGAAVGGSAGAAGSAGSAGQVGLCGEQTLCGETCIDTTNNPLHCGTCDRDCLGAACSGGQCQPESIHAETGLARFAVDATHVYYFAPDPDNSARRALRRVPIAGGAEPQDLALDQTPALADLLIDGTHVYWAGGSNSANSYVRRVLKGGGTTQNLLTGTVNPSWFGASSSSLFFTASDPVNNVRTLHKLNKDGGDYAELETTTAQLRGVAASSSFVYYAETSPTEQNVRRRTTAKLGNPSSIVTSQAGIEEVIFDANEVFWSGSGFVRKASADGSNVVDIGSATGDIEGLAVDATNVYWTELASGQRNLMAAPRSGAEQRTLLSAIGSHSLGVGKYQVHADGSYVYYLNASGDEVMRVAK